MSIGLVVIAVSFLFLARNGDPQNDYTLSPSVHRYLKKSGHVTNRWLAMVEKRNLSISACPPPGAGKFLRRNAITPYAATMENSRFCTFGQTMVQNHDQGFGGTRDCHLTHELAGFNA